MLKERNAQIILLFGVTLLLLPIPYERLHDDEIIYWEIAKNTAQGTLFKTSTFDMPFIGHFPLPFIINALFLFFNEHIFVSRIVSSLFSLGTAVLIFYIARMLYGENPALAGSLLFLFSFHTLRFGTRFYLDIYGTFFFVLAVYFLLRERVALSEFAYALAILGREMWLGMLPFILFFAWRKKYSLRRFTLFMALPFVPFFAYVVAGPGLKYLFSVFSVVGILKYYVQNLNVDFIFKLLRSWSEFAVVQAIVLAGFLYAAKEDRKNRELLILILPQFVLVSLIAGFLINGALTQYPLGLQASLSIFAGAGLAMLWDKYAKPRLKMGRDLFLPVLFAVLAAQLLVFNYLATALSASGAVGVYDLGYKYDAEVIDLLNEKAKGEVIVGMHGAFVKDAAKWEWVERNVSRALEIELDWFVTYSNLVKFKQGAESVKEVEVYRIGPYVALHSHPRGYMKEVVEPAQYRKWKLRE